MPVICREAWGAAPAQDGLVPHSVSRLMIHHTAVLLEDNADAPGRFRQHQRFHLDAGWPDIAYHLGVDRAGNLYELRTPEARGDTFTDYDPTGWLLVVAEGDFDRQRPSDAQLDGMARALAWGAQTFGAPADTIAAHRDHASTSCPGDALYARLEDLRAATASLLDTGIERVDRCGEQGAELVTSIEAGST